MLDSEPGGHDASGISRRLANPSVHQSELWRRSSSRAARPPLGG